MLAAGIVLAAATQLRPGSIPIGIGEGLLAFWIFLAWIQILRTPTTLSIPILPFVYFFLVWLALLLFSALLLVADNDALNEGAWHDVISLVFMLAIALTLAVQNPSFISFCRIAKWYALFSSYLNGAAWILSFRVPSIGGINFIYENTRFRGLAENPNQLGMILVSVPFLCLYLLVRARTIFGKSLFFAGLILSLVTGLATGSNAVKVTWIAGFSILMGMVILEKVKRIILPRSVARSFTFTLIFVLSMSLIFVLVDSLTPGLKNSFLGQAVDAVKAGDEQGARSVLWWNALGAISESPIVGWGPGRYVRLYAMKDPQEVHNSYLDLTVATGMLGLTSLIIMLSLVLWRSKLLAQPVLLSAFASILMFSLFHLTFRHPAVWITLILIAGLGYGTRQQAEYATDISSVRSPETTSQVGSTSSGVASGRRRHRERAAARNWTA